MYSRQYKIDANSRNKRKKTGEKTLIKNYIRELRKLQSIYSLEDEDEEKAKKFK